MLKIISNLYVGNVKYSRTLFMFAVVMYITSDNISFAMIFAELISKSMRTTPKRAKKHHHG